MLLPRIESLRGSSRRFIRRLASTLGPVLLISSLAASSAHAQALQPGGPVSFGSVDVGQTSLNLTLTFSATVQTTISSVITTEDGAQSKDFVLVSQNCTGTLFAAQSCNVTINFTPLHAGLRKGAISIFDGSGAVANRLYLHGLGVGPQLVFSPVSAVPTVSLSGITPAGFQTSTSVYDGLGNLYVNDYLNGRLLKIDSTNAASVVTTQVGNLHSAIAINGAGTLFLTSPTEALVKVIVPGGSVSNLNTGSVTLVSPSGIAVDGAGYIYIADSQTNTIARIAPDGSTSDILPLTGLTTPLSTPCGLAVDNDFLYIADTGNGRIVSVALGSGAATALTAGNTFINNYALAVEPSGNLIVANAGGAGIEELTTTGGHFSLTAAPGQTTASTPLGINLTTSGDILSSDADLGLVKITRSTGDVVFPTATKVGDFDSTDGYKTLTVQNSGNLPIQFSATDPAFTPTDFAVGATNTCPLLQATSTPLAIGATCTYSIGFTPGSIGAVSGTLTIAGTTVGTVPAIGVTGTATLAGTGISQLDALTVVATPASTAPGAPVAFTVTALEGSAVVTTFTGTVTFTMTDATGVFLGGASYTFTSSDAGTHTFAAPVGAQFNTPGTYTITATFGSVVGASNNVIVRYPSQTALTSSVNPTVINSPTTFTATVSEPGAALVPSGTITFFNGGTQLGQCTLVTGTCGPSQSFTTAGSYPISAVYSGDTNFATSTSAILTQVVTSGIATVALSSSINPTLVNQQTTLTAVVTPSAGQPSLVAPIGTVTFMDGTTVLDAVTLTTNTAIFPVSFSVIGNHSITAVYSGNQVFGPATSATLVQVVNGYATQAILTSSINPSDVGQSTILTATISALPGQTGSSTPTGSVTFQDGATPLGAVALTNGVAVLPFAFTTSGNHPLTAVYAGTSAYAAATSAALTQVVVGHTAQATLTSSINPTFINQSTLFTATVSAVAGQTGAGAPTGTVTLQSGGATLGSGALVNGVASIPVAFPAAGNYPITVTYSGDSSFNGFSASPTGLTQQVIAQAPAISLTSSANPVFIENLFTLTATVAAIPGQGSLFAPTGAVSFFQGFTALGTRTIVNGQASLQTSFSSIGTYPVTAVYNGDPNFLSTTSPILNELVEDFSIAIAPGGNNTATVLGGNSTSYTFTVAPIGNTVEAGPITFGLGGFPLGTTAVFSPASLPSGAASTVVTLTVTPPAVIHTQLDPGRYQLHPRSTRYAPVVLAFLLMPFAAFSRKRRRPAALFLWLLLCGFAIGLTGCLTSSSSGYYGNTPTTSTLTVTATSGNLSRSTAVTLITQ